MVKIMVGARDVKGEILNKKLAEELKQKIQQPAWSLYVKTGYGRERPPEQKDWWYLRAAGILRRIYLDGPIGVNKLRSYYGCRHRKGHKQAHFAVGSGKIIRVILRDLEKLGYIKQVVKPKKGRVITPEGQKFLNKVAKEC